MAIWIPDDDDIDAVISAARRLCLCFPENIPSDEDEVSFNIPAIAVNRLRDALKKLKD